MKRFLALLVLFIVCQLVSTFAVIKTLYSIFTGNHERSWELLKSYDRLGNAALNGNGKETVSARAYRGMIEGNRKWCLLCRLLDRIDKDHCLLSKDV